MVIRVASAAQGLKSPKSRAGLRARPGSASWRCTNCICRLCKSSCTRCNHENDTYSNDINSSCISNKSIKNPPAPDVIMIMILIVMIIIVIVLLTKVLSSPAPDVIMIMILVVITITIIVIVLIITVLKLFLNQMYQVIPRDGKTLHTKS